MENLKPGVPCDHPGCLSHISHPCEGCGRIAGYQKPNVLNRQDILEGPYRSNPTVHAAITLWQRGGCTWEEAMIYAVIQLARQNEDLEVRVRDKISKEPDSHWKGIHSFVGR